MVWDRRVKSVYSKVFTNWDSKGGRTVAGRWMDFLLLNDVVKLIYMPPCIKSQNWETSS